ncbi:glycosaminoglycan xylosylkinase-like [Gigantopelta aegis]|uniref:glycosaminoglycan xylosylkinase-like n=1 Tax=Gigantopelta aegis TaxID=1735272 RepID=UPI001B88E32E|nr:glycosaminoglycan xylosylkinase-like [Gigantopelta aegis]
MKLKFRVLVLSCIIFMVIISLKILEPEIGSHWTGNKDLRSHDDDEVDIVVEELIKKYRVDYRYSLRESPWLIASRWVTMSNILLDNPPELGGVLREMATREIISADVGYRGTQLKLLLVLKGGQKVAFKPMWYTRDYLVTGPPYGGADRHNGEIASFHLGRILEFRRTPLAVGRKINLEKEIMPVSTPELLKTFFVKDNDTCFYGKCYYCKGPADGVCADGDVLEGTVVLWLPTHLKLKAHRHPWARRYSEGKKAPWEENDKYCTLVRQIELYKKTRLLLDIVDTAIFDYLIGNADRHLYETFAGHNDSMLLILDNAKSFGNPHVDVFDILSPLKQCCSVRFSTWQKLLELQNGILSKVLRQVLSQDPVAPVITEPYLEALDRRLKHIIVEIEHCANSYGMRSIVMVES